MAKTGWQGRQLLVKVGNPNSGVLSGTYGNGPLAGGFKQISAISNAPLAGNLFTLPTGRTKSLAQQKSQERLKFFGSGEDGIVFENSGGWTGPLGVVLVRKETDDSLYDPSVELLLAAGTTTNRSVYILYERYMGLNTLTNKHRYHHQSGLFLVSSDGQSDAESGYVMENFTLSSNSDVINGYIEYAA
jgi:hypothetical protein